jgi:hypothetical protein
MVHARAPPTSRVTRRTGGNVRCAARTWWDHERRAGVCALMVIGRWRWWSGGRHHLLAAPVGASSLPAAPVDGRGDPRDRGGCRGRRRGGGPPPGALAISRTGTPDGGDGDVARETPPGRSCSSAGGGATVNRWSSAWWPAGATGPDVVEGSVAAATDSARRLRRLNAQWSARLRNDPRRTRTSGSQQRRFHDLGERSARYYLNAGARRDRPDREGYEA